MIARFLATTAVHVRVSVAVTGAFRIAMPIVPPGPMSSPASGVPKLRSMSEMATSVSVALSRVSPPATPSRSTSTRRLLSAKLAEPVRIPKTSRSALPETRMPVPTRSIVSVPTTSTSSVVSEVGSSFSEKTPSSSRSSALRQSSATARVIVPSVGRPPFESR